MGKNSTKKNGDRCTKEELLDMMNEHLLQQQAFALELKAKAEMYLSDDEPDKETKRLRNQYLYSYNKQVEAVSKTSSTMIKIYNSSIFDDDEEENYDDLVD